MKGVCLLLLAAVVASGCAGIEVSDDKSIRGIPFYVKVPVLTQDTVRASSELGIRLKVIETIDINSSPKTQRSTDLPRSGPIRVLDTPANRDALDKLLAQIPETTSATYEDTVDYVEKQTLPALAKLPSFAVSVCNETDYPVATNSWTVAMVADPKIYYVVTKQPVFGSATANFKFAADGTMTESNVAVTDDTAKTLLSLFPISARLLKQWGVDEGAATTKNADAATLALRSYSFDFGKVTPQKVVAAQRKVAVEATIEYAKTFYTLRHVQRLKDGAEMNAFLSTARKALPYCSSRDGAGGVQLVAVTPQGSGEDKGKGSDKSWQIQGSVIPPRATDAAADAEK